jgi:predicted amidophosphoribosyltransferase
VATKDPYRWQKRWAQKNVNRGRCASCGKKRKQYKRLCDYCQGKATIYMKRYRVAERKAKEAKLKALGKL